jgi:hypothetical protein
MSQSLTPSHELTLNLMLRRHNAVKVLSVAMLEAVIISSLPRLGHSLVVFGSAMAKQYFLGRQEGQRKISAKCLIRDELVEGQ